MSVLKRIELSGEIAQRRTEGKKQIQTSVCVCAAPLIREAAGCGTASDHVSPHHVSYLSRDLLTALRYCSSCSARTSVQLGTPQPDA